MTLTYQGHHPDPLSQRSPLRSLGAIHRRAQPHYTTYTTPLSGDTLHPPTWGAHHQEWPMVSPGRTACS